MSTTIEDFNINYERIKSIILFFTLYGSVYLLSTSLILINYSMIKNKRPPTELIIINGLVFFASGYIFIGMVLSNRSYIKS
jgi:hypothetical protein